MPKEAKYPRILYFIQGPKATDEQKAEAYRYGPGCVFRNAKMFDEKGALEKADGVAGPAVPAPYAKAYGSAEDAIRAFTARIEANASAKPAQQLRTEKQAALASVKSARRPDDAPEAAPVAEGEATDAPDAPDAPNPAPAAEAAPEAPPAAPAPADGWPAKPEAPAAPARGGRKPAH